MIKTEQSLEIAKNRGQIYELLSYGFLNTPNEKFIQLLKDGKDFFELLLEEENLPSVEFTVDRLEEYTQEYYDRFFVPTSRAYVPPYEAAIRNRKIKGNKLEYGQLDSKETYHVKVCYEMVGFKQEKLRAFKPLKDISFPDHIAFEMAFLTQLITYEIVAREKGHDDKVQGWRNLQKQFLDEHISQWIGDLAKLAREKKEGLYSYLLNVTSTYIQKDMKWLEEDLMEERGDHDVKKC